MDQQTIVLFDYHVKSRKLPSWINIPDASQAVHTS